MIKSRLDLFDEIKNIDDSIYVGKIDEIKGDNFDTNRLYVATLFNFSINLTSYKTSWSEISYKYIFQKIQIGERIFYREIFSNAKMELFDFYSLLRLHGMYLTTPISYDKYISSITSEKVLKKSKLLS